MPSKDKNEFLDCKVSISIVKERIYLNYQMFLCTCQRNNACECYLTFLPVNLRGAGERAIFGDFFSIKVISKRPDGF